MPSSDRLAFQADENLRDSDQKLLCSPPSFSSSSSSLCAVFFLLLLFPLSRRRVSISCNIHSILVHVYSRHRRRRMCTYIKEDGEGGGGWFLCGGGGTVRWCNIWIETTSLIGTAARVALQLQLSRGEIGVENVIFMRSKLHPFFFPFWRCHQVIRAKVGLF